MHEIYLKEVRLVLRLEDGRVRVLFDDMSMVLINQSVHEVSSTIVQNFKFVFDYYSQFLKNDTDLLDANRTSVSIVLHYLYVYNNWRNMYRNRPNFGLGFKEEDFNNPDTNDIIFSYYRNMYPDEWSVKCSVLLRKTVDEVLLYYKEREKFYNK